MLKQSQFNKNGKEILELYSGMKKSGITPEQVMLYLMAHMQQTKSTKIGMDVSSPQGQQFCITVEINGGTTDEQIEKENHTRKNKSMPPGVT